MIKANKLQHHQVEPKSGKEWLIEIVSMDRNFWRLLRIKMEMVHKKKMKKMQSPSRMMWNITILVMITMSSAVKDYSGKSWNIRMPRWWDQRHRNLDKPPSRKIPQATMLLMINGIMSIGRSWGRLTTSHPLISSFSNSTMRTSQISMLGGWAQCKLRNKMRWKLNYNSNKKLKG